MSQQRKALGHLQAWRRPYFFWRMEMGTGKTKVAIDNAGILYERRDIDGLVIVAPKTIVNNWARLELPKHMPPRIDRRVLTWRTPRTKAWGREYDALLEYPGLAVLIVNVEACSASQFAESPVGDMLRRFLKRRTCMMILDESTTIKTPAAVRTQNLCRVAKLAKFRRALTGSPLLPMELYSQCQFLEPGLLGHASFSSFKAHFGQLESVGRPLPIEIVEAALRDGPDSPAGKLYARVEARRPKSVVGYQNLDELGQMLARFSYHVTKAECLDLPDKIYVRREVEMTPPQAKAYADMRDRFRALIDGGEVSAPIVLAQLTRLQQILCGWVPLDDGRTATFPERRTAALLEVLAESAGSAIIWCPFKPDQYRVAERIKAAGLGDCVIVNGDTSADDRARAVDDFQAGRVRWWVGGTKVGGMGLTLVRATLVVYWANIWSLEQRAQSEDRAHRIGQTEHVTYVDLYTPGTVDQRVLEALASNMSLAEALAKASREEIRGWV